MPKRNARGRFVSGDGISGDGDDKEGSQATQDFLSLAHERFKLCEEAESEWRREALDDLKFYIGEQWPQEIRSQRSQRGAERPCLTINRLKQFKKIITNEQRQQRPAIQINPVGDGASVETASDIQGIVRHIEVGSEAEVADDVAFDHMVIGGLGYIRLLTEYVPGSFDQEIRIKQVRNPFMVYMDPRCVEPDYSDARFAFVIADLTKEEFKDQYPDSEAASLSDFSSIGDNAKDWITKEATRVAEYFYVEPETKMLYQLEDGSTTYELPEGQTPAKQRSEVVPTVKWAKITALDVLQKKDVVFDGIPLIPVLGEDLDVDGKRYLAGMVRDAKDPQRQFNYWESAKTEAIALAPKAPFKAYEEVIEGHEEEWKAANRNNYSVLVGKAVTKGNSVLPLPERQAAETPIEAMAHMSADAAANLQAVTGINDANLGQRRNDESGKAVLARQKQGDISNLHYSDNLARTKRRIGRLILPALKKVYDVPRILRIIKPDQTSEPVITHMGDGQKQDALELQQQNPSIAKIFDLSVGTYDVTVSVGPSYQTKRQEAVASIMALIQAAPEIMNLVGDLLVGNMDWNNAPEIAKRLKKMLPPQLQDDQDQSPEAQLQSAQSKLQALMQQHDALTQALQQANEVINTKKVESDAKIAIAKLDQETKVAVAEITTKSQEASMRIKVEQELWAELHGSAHETALTHKQQAHEQQQAAAQQTHDHAMADKQAESAQQQQQTQIAADQSAAEEQPAE